MRKRLMNLALSCALATLAVPVAQATSPPVPPPIAPDVGPQISRAMADLGLAFLREQPVNQNGVVSPYGISHALGLVQMAAVGDPRQQVARLLQGGSTAPTLLGRYLWEIHPALTRINTDITLRQANRMWLNARLKPTNLPYYTHDARLYYQSDVVLQNFDNPGQAASTINAWVKQQTLGRIGNMLDPAQLPPSTQMMLVNAVSFRGQWRNAFPPERTVAATFTLDDGHTVRVPTMHALVHARSTQQDGARWLELPFGTDAANAEWVMQIAVPPRGQSLAQFQQQLTGAQWQATAGQLQAKPMRLALPRFSLKGVTRSLRETVMKLGVMDVFSDKANLLGITDDKNLFVDEVFHSAAFDVDETGIEGCAATQADTKKVRSPPPFVVDRPFLFFIVHRPTGTPVLMGRMTNPAQGSE